MPPTIERGLFGLSERDLPSGGIVGVAVWPVIESNHRRPAARVIRRVRHRLAWREMTRHADRIVDLELVDPPTSAVERIAAARRRAGLRPAVVR